MATFSALISDSSGIRSLSPCASYPKLPNLDSKLHRFSRLHRENTPFSRRNLNLQMQDFHRSSRAIPVLSAGRNNPLSYSEDSHTEPFWLNLIRETIWSVRSLLIFLAEQPGQLKYIEWPSFQSTLKTAVLTLVLVAMLIVALSSVDSALSFLLALFLRRKA